MLCHFKIPVEGIPIVIFAICSCIILADLGTGFINAAPVVLAKMFAGTVYQKEPVVVFCEPRGIFMEQIPADIKNSITNGARRFIGCLGEAAIEE